MLVRIANRNEFGELGRVMFDAVHASPSPYTQAQRNAWISAPRHGAQWDERLASQTIIVGADGERILGFMSLAQKGYIDFADIRAEARGVGLFRKLYEEIEKFARLNEVDRLWTHASLSAQPAFSSFDFSIVKKEQVPLGVQKLTRYEMEKNLQ